MDERAMAKSITITVDEKVFEGLHRVVDSQRISSFIENLIRPQVLSEDLDAAYAEMAADETREAAAEEWADALITDAADETR